MDRPRRTSRGGVGLMLNVYNAYAISPVRHPRVKVHGALAFLDFLTSPRFQDALATFPSRERPGFYAAATPRVTLTGGLPPRVPTGGTVTVSGRVASAIPGAPPPLGMPVRLERRPSARPDAGVPLTRGRADGAGAFRLRARLDGGGDLVLTAPRHGRLSPLRLRIGHVAAP